MRFYCPECHLAYHVDKRENYAEDCRACTLNKLTLFCLSRDQSTYEMYRRLAIEELKKIEQRLSKRYPIADKTLPENNASALSKRLSKSENIT